MNFPGRTTAAKINWLLLEISHLYFLHKMLIDFQLILVVALQDVVIFRRHLIRDAVAVILQLIPFACSLTMRGIPRFQPSHHLPYFPLVRSFDKVWLGSDIQYTCAIPVMTAAGDQQLILPVPCAGIAPVIAHITPDIAPSVD